jgi:hypothetical protein
MPNWTVDINGGCTLYTVDHCIHGPLACHTLSEALPCGILQDARATRGQTQPAAARTMGVGLTTIRGWEHGRRHPAGLQRKALEAYLVETFTGVDTAPASAVE